MKFCWWEWWWSRKWVEKRWRSFQIQNWLWVIRGDLGAWDPRMQEYLSQVRRIQTKFEFFDISHIPKGGNTHADSLATLTTSLAQDLPWVILVKDLCTPTPLHKDMPRIHQIKLGPSWMDLISLFLEKDILPEEKTETEKVQKKAHRF